MRIETKEITFEDTLYNVPVWVNYIAKNGDGKVIGYANRPIMVWNRFVPIDNDFCTIVDPGHNWQKSLISL